MALRTTIPASGSAPDDETSPAARPLFDTEAVDWIDYLDADGESYVFFSIDNEWPGPYGDASRGAP